MDTATPPMPPAPGSEPNPPRPERKTSKTLQIAAIVLGAVLVLGVLGAVAQPAERGIPEAPALPSDSALTSADESVDPKLASLVDEILAMPKAPPISLFCQGLDFVGDDVAFREFSKSAGPGKYPGGYSNRDVFDEIRRRC